MSEPEQVPVSEPEQVPVSEPEQVPVSEPEQVPVSEPEQVPAVLTDVARGPWHLSWRFSSPAINWRRSEALCGAFIALAAGRAESWFRTSTHA